MRRGVQARAEAVAQGRAGRLRAAIARSLTLAGVDDVVIEGEAVRASGRGLGRRWMDDPVLRDAGRGGI